MKKPCAWLIWTQGIIRLKIFIINPFEAATLSSLWWFTWFQGFCDNHDQDHDQYHLFNGLCSCVKMASMNLLITMGGSEGLTNFVVSGWEKGEWGQNENPTPLCEKGERKKEKERFLNIKKINEPNLVPLRGIRTMSNNKNSRDTHT